VFSRNIQILGDSSRWRIYRGTNGYVIREAMTN
jgi:hypothetical protein